MRINFSSTKANQTYFGSRPIYPIQLKKINKDNSVEYLSGNFSEVKNNNLKDMKLMREIYDKWKSPSNIDNYTNMIYSNFLSVKQNNEEANSFYVVELSNPQNSPYENVKTIIETTNPNYPIKSEFFIDFIQAVTALFPQNNGKIKGAGALAMYGAVKIAKENDFTKIRIFSLNDDFYCKIGFPPPIVSSEFGSYFILQRRNFNKFLKNIEERYFKKTN